MSQGTLGCGCFAPWEDAHPNSPICSVPILHMLPWMVTALSNCTLIISLAELATYFTRPCVVVGATSRGRRISLNLNYICNQIILILGHQAILSLTQTYTHTYTERYTHRHMCKHTERDTDTHIHTERHRHTNTHTSTHTHAHTHAHTFVECSDPTGAAIWGH